MVTEPETVSPSTMSVRPFFFNTHTVVNFKLLGVEIWFYVGGDFFVHLASDSVCELVNRSLLGLGGRVHCVCLDQVEI